MIRLHATMSSVTGQTCVLDVKILAPVHSQVMRHEETLQYLAPGRLRVQQRCAEHEARGEFLPRGEVSSTRQP